MTNEISMKQVNSLLNYIIDNNFALEEKGETPIAIALESTAGIGKTSIVQQIAKGRGMNCVKLNFSEIEEQGDLIGFPIKEYECQVAKKVKSADGTVKMQILPQTMWVNEKQLDSPTPGLAYRQTGKTRMAYAKPAWVPEYCENGTICLLDDYVRASPQLLQAAMDLILTQEYVSWRLPKKTTIVLTNNPDDGSNNVNSLDEAQASRFLNFGVKFDIDAWAQWAERKDLDGRCINFVLSYHDILFKANEEGNRICNPRSFVLFANTIAGMKNWDDPETLSFISMMAKGCFKDEDDRFSKMFALFIKNKMHTLIQPSTILKGNWSDVKKKLEETLYDSNGTYRADIATLIERRFCNYISAWLDSEEKSPISVVHDRLLEIIENEEKGGKRIFTMDLLYHLVKTITADHKRQTSKLLLEPKIARAISDY